MTRKAPTKKPKTKTKTKAKARPRTRKPTAPKTEVPLEFGEFSGADVLGNLTVCIGIYKKYPEVETPQRQTEYSSCYDLKAYLKTGMVVNVYDAKNVKHDVVLKSDGLSLAPSERALVPTGIHFDIPEGFSLRIHPRSGIALKQGLSLINCQGIIDSDYTDQTMITICNFSEERNIIRHGDRLAQVEVYEELSVQFVDIGDVPEVKGNRTGGFGSTGVK